MAEGTLLKIYFTISPFKISFTATNAGNLTLESLSDWSWKYYICSWIQIFSRTTYIKISGFIPSISISLFLPMKIKNWNKYLSIFIWWASWPTLSIPHVCSNYSCLSYNFLSDKWNTNVTLNHGIPARLLMHTSTYTPLCQGVTHLLKRRAKAALCHKQLRERARAPSALGRSHPPARAPGPRRTPPMLTWHPR